MKADGPKPDMKMTRKAQANREKFQELDQIFEGGVRSITRGDAGSFREYSRQAIACLKELYPDEQDFQAGILQASLCT